MPGDPAESNNTQRNASSARGAILIRRKTFLVLALAIIGGELMAVSVAHLLPPLGTFAEAVLDSALLLILLSPLLYYLVVRHLVRETEEERNVELQLKKAAEDLDRIVNERTTELQQTNQQLLREIDERNKTAVSLEETLQLNNSLLKTIPFKMDIVDRDGTILYVNSTLLSELVEFPIGKKCWDVYRDDHSQCAHCPLKKGVALGETDVLESNGAFKGKTFLISHTGMMYQGKQAVLEIFQDITERVRAERELKMNEERYKNFFEHDFTGVYTSTPSGMLLDCNPAFLRIFGFTSVEEFREDDLTNLYPGPRDRMEFLRLLEQHKVLDYYEVELRRRDGTPVYVIENATGIFDEQGRLVRIIGFLFDNTENKKLAAQLIQAQKMESLGTLAGGIAHDFNNILGIILGHTNLLQLGSLSADRTALSLETIAKSVHRGAGLVRQILTFARKAEPSLEPININKAIKDLADMLVETFPKTIYFQLELDENLPVTSMDHTQFNQMILNLCINARDAMMDDGESGGGRKTLTIKTVSVKGKDLQTQFPQTKLTTYVVISIADTGTGMDAITKAKIFDPFFTTKGPGKGTGLGLAVVYGIVQSHHGFIDCQSIPRQGTTFTIYLPVAVVSQQLAGLSPEEEQTIPGGDETVLLVEDEESLREVMKMILEGKGYHVLTAGDGIEAIQLYATHYGKIALVLSDIGLPKLDGLSLFSAIKDMSPRQKIALASGYVSPDQKSELLKSGAIDFFQKPFVMSELLIDIRKILDQ